MNILYNIIVLNNLYHILLLPNCKGPDFLNNILDFSDHSFKQCSSISNTIDFLMNFLTLSQILLHISILYYFQSKFRLSLTSLSYY